MATKDSLLTYHDGRLAQIAAIYGDYLESLCLIEKFSILTDIAGVHPSLASLNLRTVH